MKSIVLFFVGIFLSFISHSQNDPDIVGYRLRTKGTIVKVYQSKMEGGTMLNEPDLSVWNKWENETYWFKTDITFKDPHGSEYIRITIPNSVRYDEATDSFVTTLNYNNINPWGLPKLGMSIDPEDYNSWLWILKSDFEAFKSNYYGRPKAQFLISAITIPFKYRFKAEGHSSSIFNGDVNIGTYIGLRKVYINNTLGINIGGVLGVSSLPMNASNNDSITDKSTQSVTGLNYGGALVLDWQKKFQIGVVLGWDHAVGDLSKTYIYQDRMWVGFSLNFKFLDFAKDDEKQTSKKTTKN